MEILEGLVDFLKEREQFSDLSDEERVNFESAIKSAEAYIYNKTGWATFQRDRVSFITPIVPGDYITYDGAIDAITALKLDGEEVDISEVVKRFNEHHIFTYEPLTSEMEVNYTIGYPDYESVPTDLAEAIIILAKKLIESGKTDGDVTTHQSITIKESVSFVKGFPVEVELLIAPYTLIRI